MNANSVIFGLLYILVRSV